MAGNLSKPRSALLKENLVEYEDSEEEGEFAQKDSLQIHQVLPLRQIAPDKIENEEFVPRITYEDFSTNGNQENLVDYEDSEEEGEFAQKDSLQIHQVLPLRQIAPDKIVNEEFVPRITYEDFSINANQESLFNTSSNSIKWDFVDMGYSSAMVEKAISIHGNDNWNEILEYLLACKVADYSLDLVPANPTVDSERLEGADEINFADKKVKIEDTFSEHGEPQEDRSNIEADYVIASLLEMGYAVKEVSSALEINGTNTPMHELLDFIDAHICGNEIEKYAKDTVVGNHEDKMQKTHVEESCASQFRKRKQAGDILNDMETSSSASRKRAIGEKQRKVLKCEKYIESMQDKQAMFEVCDAVPNLCPKELIGFGVPGKPIGQRSKEINAFMQGPPFFYYENDAFASKDIWKTISEQFNGVEPELVDSMFFSASRRARGYVHNLPIEERFQAEPLPPMTIQEALPQTKKYWPSWDQRTKLNSIDSRRCGTVLIDQLRVMIQNSRGQLQDSAQKYILQKCEEWNLVWVGPGDLVPLELHEIELILGFDRDHTRGTSCPTDRLHCLGNSFQIDTVAYHLSVLKALYPDGIRVLSLFSGIGGAEVALHQLGIHLSCVVSVEICEKSRLVLSSWWTKTQQTGRLIQKEDVQGLTTGVLEDLVEMVGGFDLIIGGLTCNNLPGKNGKDNGEAAKDSVFYEFPRIVMEVREIMHSKASANNFS